MITRPVILFLLCVLSFSTFSQIRHFPETNYDLDGDGKEDFRFEYEWEVYSDITVSWVSVTPLNGAEVAIEEVEVTSYDKDWYVQYFEFGDTIDDNLIWSADKEIIADSYYRKPDAWYVDGDYFLGIRLKNDDGYQYGWLRFNTKYLYMNFSRDAAAQSISNVQIKAGEGITSIAPVAGPVTIENNNNTWSDIHIWFYPSWFDAFVQEYRAFVVKTNKAGEITIERLLEASTVNYHNVAPGDYSYNFLLKDSLFDLDNEGINLGENYRICLLSVSKNTDSFPHAFTLTQSFILNTELPPVNSPAVFDVADNENSTDIQVVFSKSEKEEFVEEYRIMILPNDSAAAFNLEKAAEVAEGNFYVIPPGGDSVYTIQNIEMTDIYGDPIEQKQKYNAFIWSVPDQENANIASLSEPSNVFALSVPDYIYAGQSTGKNIAFNEGNLVVTSDSCFLDIENDGKNDLVISGLDVTDTNHRRFNIVAHPRENMEVIFSEQNLAKNLTENTPVYENFSWSSNPLTLRYIQTDFEVGPVYGEFTEWRDGYLGFRKISEKDTIYGWALVNTGRIKDYAWQKRVTQSVIEIPDSGENLFVAYPNPTRDRVLNIAIKNFGGEKDSFLDVFNSSGLKMKRILVTEPLFQINLNGMPGGLYYVQLTTPEKQETQKVLMQ
jgi:hypothetical protein